MWLGLAIPAFVAGLIMFLAPCTFPLVPGFLGFISGGKRVFVSALFYVIGFSAVFVAMGSLIGWGGGWLLPYRWILVRVGGVFVILFGMTMIWQKK